MAHQRYPFLVNFWKVFADESGELLGDVSVHFVVLVVRWVGSIDVESSARSEIPYPPLISPTLSESSSTELSTYSPYPPLQHQRLEATYLGTPQQFRTLPHEAE